MVRENGNEVRKYVTPDTWVTLETTLSLKNDMGDFWGLGFFLNDNIQDGADTDGRIHDETFTFYVKNVQII